MEAKFFSLVTDGLTHHPWKSERTILLLSSIHNPGREQGLGGLGGHSPCQNEVLVQVRLKVHPYVPSASLPNLNDFPNPNVPGLI